MSITSRINEMSSHIEQAYDELQGLGADLTNVNKNIENISMVLDDIYDSLPSVSGEGTSLTLDDTRVGKIKSTLKGNTSQETTTGKNKASDVWEEYIQSTGTANYRLYPLTLEQGKTYMLSGVLVGTQKTSYYNFGIVKDGDNYNNFVDPHFAVDYNTGNGQQYTFTVDNSFISPKLICYVTSKSVFEELFTNYNIQLEEGSSVTSFEPYTNGASPNPDYPQEVHVVSGDNEINVCGKNIFDGVIEQGSYDASTGAKTGSDVFYRNANKIPVLPSTTYTFSINGVSQRYVVLFYQANGTFISQNASLTTGTFTTPSNAYYVNFRCFQSDYTSDYATLKVQLEKGSSATTYEAFNGNTYNIDLGVENLCDITNGGSSIGGVPFTIENGVIKINGTTSSSTASNYFNVFQTNSGSAVFSIEVTGYTDKSSGNSALILQQSNDGTTGWSTFSELSLNSAYLKQSSVTLDSSKYYRLRWYVDNNTFTNAKIKVQLEYGNKKNSFTPYGTTPIELCKIGNYQDYFYKDSGKWYLHKEIGKVVLNGSEEWKQSGAMASVHNILISDYDSPINSYTVVNNIISSHFISGVSYANLTETSDYNGRVSATGDKYISFKFSDTTSINDWESWLSSHNVVVYYVLATPTTEELTYEPLITQLNLLEKAQSKENQTNISQVNNDLPFIISASALKEWQESTSLNSTLSMVNPLSLENTLNTQKNDIQPIEVDNIEPLEEEENEES